MRKYCQKEKNQTNSENIDYMKTLYKINKSLRKEEKFLSPKSTWPNGLDFTFNLFSSLYLLYIVGK